MREGGGVIAGFYGNIIIIRGMDGRGWGGWGWVANG